MEHIRAPAVILLSGGMDSTACAVWAARTRPVDRLLAVLFGYGQPHRDPELAAAGRLAAQLGIASLRLETADTFPRPVHMATAPHATNGQHPAIVPGRNLGLLNSAVSHAIARWPDEHTIDVWIGACADDRAVFDDCGRTFFDAAEHAISLGTSRKVRIVAPLLDVSKRELVFQASADAELFAALSASYSCYRGGKTGCGECTPCVLRAEAFAAIDVADNQIAAGQFGGDPHREPR